MPPPSERAAGAGVRALSRLGACPRLACCAVALAVPALAQAAIVTGTVIGEGARPFAGARVEVVRADPPCAATTAPDGTFSLPCPATGRHVVRASFGDLRPWEIEDVELAPDREVHLSFMLLPPAPVVPRGALPGASAEPPGFWTRRLPNPVVASWQGRAITRRALAIVVAAVSFVLGALTMVALGRHFGVRTRRLSADEVGDMVRNPLMPSPSERVTPVATIGARGASATIGFGADEIAAALAEGRYGLLFVSLVIAPGLFALFALGLAVAMLVGQETYLLYATLLVPAGFVLTPIVIGVQAFTRRRSLG